MMHPMKYVMVLTSYQWMLSVDRLRGKNPVGVMGVWTPMGPWNLKNCGGPWGSNIKNYIKTWAHQNVNMIYIYIYINKYKFTNSKINLYLGPRLRPTPAKVPVTQWAQQHGPRWALPPLKSRSFKGHSRFRGSVRAWSMSRSSKESSRLRAPVGSGRLGESLSSKGPICLRDSGGFGHLGNPSHAKGCS